MIIKRWDGSAFVEEFPKTKAQLVFNNGNTESIFDGSDKLRLNYLPDAVFDSLYFDGTTGDVFGATSGSLGTLTKEALTNAATATRSAKGFYYVADDAFTFSPTSTSTAFTGTYIVAVFSARDNDGVGEASAGGTSTNNVLEIGDWLVLTTLTGAGTVGSPYIATWAVVNNVYDNATTGIFGLSRLSSRSTYASLSGDNVVTEGVLKTVVDNAAFASGTHVHGNITNAGAIGSTASLPIITTTSGVLTTGAFGTTAGTFGQGNDARFSDARTPTSHVHGNITNVGAIGTTANLPIITTTSGVLIAGAFGSTANTFTQGNDSRLSDARTPTSHVHGDISNAGAITSTVITPATGDAIILSDTSASDALKRGISIGTGTTTFLRNDGTWGTPVDTNTTYSAATSTVLGLVELFSDTVQSVAAEAVSATASRTYGVQLNANNQAVVNVPWSDTNTVATVTALGGLSATSNSFQMVHPFFVQADAPATPLTGTIWFDI
jgi:hypothetical protein